MKLCAHPPGPPGDSVMCFAHSSPQVLSEMSLHWAASELSLNHEKLLSWLQKQCGSGAEASTPQIVAVWLLSRV